MDSKILREASLSYLAIYDQDLREEMEACGMISKDNKKTQKEDFELWVNNLLDEGYDLSGYTWDEMAEIYLDESRQAQMYGQSELTHDYDERNLKNRGDLSKRDAGSIARSRLTGQRSAVGRVRGSNPHNDGHPVNNEAYKIAAPSPEDNPDKYRKPETKPYNDRMKAKYPLKTKPLTDRTKKDYPNQYKEAYVGEAAYVPPNIPAVPAEVRTSTAKKPALPTVKPTSSKKSERGQGLGIMGPVAAWSAYKLGQDAARRPRSILNPLGYKRESYDFYDAVLEHLFVEGYANTLESAEAIMANMSEEWIDSILDEERAPGVKPYKPNRLQPLPEPKPLSGKTGDRSGYGPDEKFKKPDDRIKKPGTEVPPVQKYGRIFSNIPHGIGAHANRERSRNSTIRGMDPGAPRSEKIAPQEKKKPSREIVRLNREDFDIYDIILSHLINEGYAESVEEAEVIMVNMSEEWRNSIIG